MPPLTKREGCSIGTMKGAAGQGIGPRAHPLPKPSTTNDQRPTTNSSVGGEGPTCYSFARDSFDSGPLIPCEPLGSSPRVGPPAIRVSACGRCDGFASASGERARRREGSRSIQDVRGRIGCGFGSGARSPRSVDHLSYHLLRHRCRLRIRNRRQVAGPGVYDGTIPCLAETVWRWAEKDRPV